MIKSISQLKRAFGNWGVQSVREFVHLIDSLNPVHRVAALTDGAAVSWNCQNAKQCKAFLDTAESAVTLTISNMGEVANLVVKPSASGGVTITLSGTGYKYVDLDNIANPAATVDVSCANAYNEVSISDSGDTDSGDKVLLVVVK